MKVIRMLANGAMAAAAPFSVMALAAVPLSAAIAASSPQHGSSHSGPSHQGSSDPGSGGNGSSGILGQTPEPPAATPDAYPPHRCRPCQSAAVRRDHDESAGQRPVRQSGHYPSRYPRAVNLALSVRRSSAHTVAPGHWRSSPPLPRSQVWNTPFDSRGARS